MISAIVEIKIVYFGPRIIAENIIGANEKLIVRIVVLIARTLASTIVDANKSPAKTIFRY